MWYDSLEISKLLNASQQIQPYSFKIPVHSEQKVSWGCPDAPAGCFNLRLASKHNHYTHNELQ